MQQNVTKGVSCEKHNNPMRKKCTGKHAIILSGSRPLISVDRLSQSGLSENGLSQNGYGKTYAYIYTYIHMLMDSRSSHPRILRGPGCPNELFGTPVRAGDRCRKICWILVARTLAAWGGLWRPSGTPLKEDTMIRFFCFSILAPRSWVPAAWVPGG